MNVTIQRAEYIGETTAVPSKSSAHRVLIACALSSGYHVVENAGYSDDVSATLTCLQALGASVERKGDTVRIGGIDEVKKGGVLDAKESGSTLRFLLPVVAALGAEATFTGQGRLFDRPNTSLLAALQSGGVLTDGKKLEGKLTCGTYVIDATVSSQYVSGLLFALPLLGGDSRIKLSGNAVSKNYIDMTLEVLSLAGIDVFKEEDGFFIPGGQKYAMPEKVRCDGDWSSAAFMLVAGAIGKEVTVHRLRPDSLQGDKKILEILKKTGAEVTQEGDKVTVRSAQKNPFEADIEDIPDLAPVLAVLASTLPGTSVLRSVHRLKIKESDRLEAICQMLSVGGIAYKKDGDDLFITGGKARGGNFDGKADHRMVMSAALLAGLCQESSTVSDAEAVKKSYPSFFEDYKKIGGQFYVGMEG